MSYDYGYSTSSQTRRSLWYYLIFPLDAWKQGEEDPGFEAQKSSEIWPLMIFLLPGIVLLAGFSLRLGFFSSLFFYGFEAALIAGVCKFYIDLSDFGLVIELFLNFWVACIAQAFCFMLMFGLLSVLF